MLDHFTPWERRNLHFWGKKQGFAKKHLLRVRFWIEKKTTRTILNLEKDNALDLELKNFRHLTIWTNVCIKTSFRNILLRENDMICIFGAFFEKRGFELKYSLRVRFCIKKTRQILNLEEDNASVCDLKILQRIRF